jgi:hypothetical protein
MKVQMIVHVKNDDGTVGAESTAVEVDVPNYEAFTGPEQFGEVFDQAEIGLLGIHTYELKEGSHKVFSTEGDVFPETGSREHFKTVCFREGVVFSACDESFRKSASHINRAWWRQEKTDQVQSRTIANVVEREGKQIQAHLRTKAEHILQDHGFTRDGSVADPQKAFASITKEDVTLSREVVCQTIEELNRGKEEEKQIDISELHAHV